MRRRELTTWLVLTTAAFLFGATVPSQSMAASARRQCIKTQCKPEKRGCVDASRAVFKAEKTACVDAGGGKREIRQCKKAVRKAFKAKKHECVSIYKTTCKPCCKADSTATCAATCGDGVRQGSEECDGQEKAACVTECRADCTCDVVTCPDCPTVRVVVEGLADGKVVTLRDGDGPVVDIGTNGPFDVPVENASVYVIVVYHNPVSQLCSVENPAGPDVRVVCADVGVLPCTGTVDTDGDGLSDCLEVDEWGTNPWQEDTDGDSEPDGSEALDFDPANNVVRDNPRIANTPAFAVDMVSRPLIYVDFETTKANGYTEVTDWGTSATNSISNDWGGETSRQLESSHTIGASSTTTFGTELKISPTDLGGSANFEESLTGRYEESETESRGSSVNWNKEETSKREETYERSVQYAEQHSTNMKGGKLLVTVQVRNDGVIAYDLEHLSLSAVNFDPSRPFDVRPIATLLYGTGTQPYPPPTPVKGGGVTEGWVFEATLDLPTTLQLLRDSRGLVIRPATFRLLGKDGESLLLAETEIQARTATIIIDKGVKGAGEEIYRVAVNDGLGDKSITAYDALTDILRLDVQQGTETWTYPPPVGSSSTHFGLLQVGQVAMDPDPRVNAYWLVAYNHAVPGSTTGRTTDVLNLLLDDYDLSTIRLRAGDTLNLVYVGDADGDGLSDRLEGDLGTKPDDAYSDLDDIIDSVELYGWTIGSVPGCAGRPDADKRVYSNPLDEDSDDDGTWDDVEKSNCEDPGGAFTVDAGAGQVVSVGTEVTLEATIDREPPEVPSYRWSLKWPPADLLDPSFPRALSGRKATFTAPDDVGTLVWTVTADAGGESTMDDVQVQVVRDAALAFFVGQTTDSVSTQNGTQEHPYGTIQDGIAAASAGGGGDLYVQTNVEPTLRGSLVVPNGVSLFGGYGRDWVRDTGTPTPLEGIGLTAPAVRIEPGNGPMWFSGFRVSAANENAGASLVAIEVAPSGSSAATGSVYLTDNVIESLDVGGSGDVSTRRSKAAGSSYGLRVRDVADVTLRHNVIRAGRGAAGELGKEPGRGCNACENAGGAGGAGGTGYEENGAAGKAGASAGSGDGGGGAGGSGGAGGLKAFKETGDGGSGGGGGAGQAGSKGPGGRCAGFNGDGLFQPSAGTDGGRGGNGGGGGGGGGGGANGAHDGGHGGAGGTGGQGGPPSGGASGGGASIGIWLWGVGHASLDGNTITAAAGGVGGDTFIGGGGGSGGAGAAGTSGVGTSSYNAGDGGAGGNGGRGGDGGPGGSGSGGPSLGLVFGAIGQSVVISNTSITSANGGAAGTTPGYRGCGGSSYAIYDLDPDTGPTIDQGTTTLNHGSGGTGSLVGGVGDVFSGP